MKTLLSAAVAALLFVSPAARALAQEAAAPAAPAPTPAEPTTLAAPAPAESGPQADLRNLVTAISAKLQAGQRTEAELAENLQGFDALLVKYADQKTDEVAEILVMKAMLYLQVFQNFEQGLVLLKQLKAEFPATNIGQKADEIITQLEQQIETNKVSAQLAPGAVFPDFSEKDLAGQPLSISAHQGKVVLVDFWATWCGPCVAELPNVLAAYEKYHAKGFEIVGISLDEDRAALDAFLAEHKMTWPQYFDGLGWKNKVSRAYGVSAIPATYLLDKEGKIVAKGLRGPALETELARLLGE